MLFNNHQKIRKTIFKLAKNIFLKIYKHSEQNKKNKLTQTEEFTWSQGNDSVSIVVVVVIAVAESSWVLLCDWRMTAVANLLPQTVHMWTRGVEWMRQWAFRAFEKNKKD